MGRCRGIPNSITPIIFHYAAELNECCSVCGWFSEHRVDQLDEFSLLVLPMQSQFKPELPSLDNT